MILELIIASCFIFYSQKLGLLCTSSNSEIEISLVIVQSRISHKHIVQQFWGVFIVIY